MKWPAVVCLVLFSPPLIAEEAVLQLQVGHSETLTIAGLTRVVVADSRLVRAKYLPPSTVLLTGLREGSTNLRLWARESELPSRAVVVTRAKSRGPGLVKVSLEFLEIDTSLSEQIGVRWPEATHFAASGAVFGSGNSSGLNYSVTFGSARGWIQHLVREGWAKLLARPELSVRLGEEGVFHSGGEFPVSATSESFGRSRRHVEWKSFGMTVKVKPQSADYWNLQSEVHVEISDLNRALEVDKVPGLSRRKLDTKIESVDGETVVLSGLLRKVATQSKEGIPGLSSIPILGSLFSAGSDTTEETELLLSLTLQFATRADQYNSRREMDKKFSESMP